MVLDKIKNDELKRRMSAVASANPSLDAQERRTITAYAEISDQTLTNYLTGRKGGKYPISKAIIEAAEKCIRERNP